MRPNRAYVLDPADKITAPPRTLPGKLAQVLWARFQAKGPAPVMLPCELIEQNADKLRESGDPASRSVGIAGGISGMGEKRMRLAEQPGRLHRDDAGAGARGKRSAVDLRGAILFVGRGDAQRAERRKPPGCELRPFGPLVADDIAPFFLRKVRILNGTHTAMVGKFLGQFETVQQLLADQAAAPLGRDLMYEEIVPTLAYRLDLVGVVRR